MRKGTMAATKRAVPSRVEASANVFAAQQRHVAVHHQQRRETDRQVEVEHPAPADGVGQDAADGRADEEGEHEERAERRLQTRPVGRRIEVSDDGQRDRHDGTGTKALDAPEDDQLPHRLAHSAQSRSDEEDGQAEEEDGAPAVPVGERAPERHGRGHGQQVDREDPGVEVIALQVADDAWQGRPHGRGIK